MVKFAKGDEKPFDPISNKLLSSIAATPPPQSPDEQQGSPEPDPSPAPHPAHPAHTDKDDSRSEPEQKTAASKKTTDRGKRPAEKRSALKKLTVVPGRGEKLSKAVKCLFTPSEEKELRQLVSRLSSEAGTSLTLSHLMRPYFDLLSHCEDALSQELRRADVTRPLNDKTALAHFERQLAEVIHSAMRKSPPLRADRQDSEE